MNFQAGPCDKDYSYPITATAVVKDGRVVGNEELDKAGTGPMGGRGVMTKTELMEANRQGSSIASISVVFYNGEPLDFTALDGGEGGRVPHEMLVPPPNTHTRATHTHAHTHNCNRL